MQEYKNTNYNTFMQVLYRFIFKFEIVLSYTENYFPVELAKKDDDMVCGKK